MENGAVTEQRPAIDRLRSRQPVFGAAQAIPSPMMTDIAIRSGYDFVMLDCEHGLVDEAAHIGSLQIAAGSHAFTAVRVRKGDLGAVGRYLEFGADAVMLPDVATPADARAFIGAASRVDRFGLGSRERGAPLLFAMIESSSAVTHIAAITATPGLDGIVIGPNDLARSLGCSNDFAAPAYTSAFAAIEKAATAAGLIMGSRAHPGFSVERLLSAGHCLILASSDIVALRDGYRAHLLTVRDRMPWGSGRDLE